MTTTDSPTHLGILRERVCREAMPKFSQKGMRNKLWATYRDGEGILLNASIRDAEYALEWQQFRYSVLLEIKAWRSKFRE